MYENTPPPTKTDERKSTKWIMRIKHLTLSLTHDT
jgi:hypothetical protein